MNQRRLVPVILSGGSGTRLWPASRTETPKQLLPLVGEHTMLRATLDRLRHLRDRLPTVVVCSEVQASSCRAEMEAAGHGDGRIVIEPAGRNTAAAVAVAAHVVEPDTVLLVMPADHVMRDVGAFTDAVTSGFEAAISGSLVTFGIVPTHPATGYGYIQTSGDGDRVRPVEEFVEKPDLPDAERYVADGRHLWNSGMFMFGAGRYLDELARYEPDVAEATAAAVARASTDEEGALVLDTESFTRSPSISVDYAVMERTDSAVVVPLDAGWSDVGSWASLMDVARQDASGNVVVGDVVAEDVDGSYLRADGVLLAVVGLSDVVAVTTPDAVLVASKDRAEDVKKVVERLRRRHRSEAYRAPVVPQSWGTSEVLYRVGDAEVVIHLIRPGATAVFAGGTAVVVQGHARGDGVDHVPGSAFAVDGEVEILNPGDEDLALLITGPAGTGDAAG